MFQSLNAKKFKKELDSNSWVLLDIRTSHEQEIYWVISENQLHIDISLLDAAQRIQELDKNKKYLIYCWHGVRSKQVMQYMQSLGFQEVYDLDWGIEEWWNISN